jgi:MHS family proline/betaine transporter-like MFS transporter
VSLIAAFGAFAAGFLARPFGGLVLGRLGDVVGRRQVLMISIFCMAIPTVLIGLLPSYEHMGIVAPILVVLLRIIQGLSVGGEYTSSAVFLAEHAPPDRRGLMASWSTWGTVAGILLGSGIGAVFSNLLTDAQIGAWGWRIPFLMGGGIAVIGLLLRRGLTDTEPPAKNATPVIAVFRDHLGAMGRIIGMNLGISGVGFYLVFVYSVTYIKSVDQLSGAIAFDLNTGAMALMLVIMPLAAWLSDKLGRKPLLLGGLAGVVLGAIPCFMLIHSTDPVHIFTGLAILSVFIGMFAGPISATNVEQLPREVRCTGLAISYNLSVGLFGGTAPLIAAWLIRGTGDPLSPSYYLLAVSVISFVAVLGIKDKAKIAFD